MDLAASVAQSMAFPSERVDDIRTAVAEATLNAIEHGNALDPDKPVLIALTWRQHELEICIEDQAHTPLRVQADAPSAGTATVEDRLSGRAHKRGWGIQLIRLLTDAVEFDSTDQSNTVRMIIRLPNRDSRPRQDRMLSSGHRE